MKKTKDREALENAVLEHLRLLRKLQQLTGWSTSEVLVRLARVWREDGEPELVVLSHGLVRELRRLETMRRREAAMKSREMNRD